MNTEFNNILMCAFYATMLATALNANRHAHTSKSILAALLSVVNFLVFLWAGEVGKMPAALAFLAASLIFCCASIQISYAKLIEDIKRKKSENTPGAGNNYV